MKIRIELDAEQIKKLVVDHINEQLGSLSIEPQQVRFMVKSKQNYKAEWEPCDLKAEAIPEMKAEIGDLK